MKPVNREPGGSHNQVELVAFRLSGQEFCVDIMDVREIRGWTPVTPIPHAPHYVTGVINLRGSVLPIIDLSSRFGMAATVPSERHVIIVMQLGNRTAGLLVDAVSDVLSCDTSSIQPTPDVISSLAQSFIRGVLALNGRLISVVTPEQILPEAQVEAA